MEVKGRGEEGKEIGGPAERGRRWFILKLWMLLIASHVENSRHATLASIRPIMDAAQE